MFERCFWTSNRSTVGSVQILCSFDRCTCITFVTLCDCRTKSLGRRHTLSSGSSSSSVGGLTVHSWFAASSLITKCIWSTAVAQHQFYIDIKHTVSQLCLILAIYSYSLSVNNITRCLQVTHVCVFSYHLHGLAVQAGVCLAAGYGIEDQCRPVGPSGSASLLTYFLLFMHPSLVIFAAVVFLIPTLLYLCDFRFHCSCDLDLNFDTQIWLRCYKTPIPVIVACNVRSYSKVCQCNEWP